MPCVRGTSKVEKPECIVQSLVEKRDYVALAGFVTRGGVYDYSTEYFRARDAAKEALRNGAAVAVPAIVKELESARRSWRAGLDDLAEIICEIGDPQGVAILKHLLDDGSFDAFPSTKDEVRQFVDKWPAMHPLPQTATCLLCERIVPLNETKAYGDDLGREWRLCESCWPNRAGWLHKIETNNPEPFSRRHPQ